MDGIIFTESFSFRNWTVSPTPPSKKKSILDEFPSSQWLLFMTTAFLSSSICFACGQIQLLHEFNILDSTNPYLSVCFIHHAICQCMYSYSMGLRIFWKLRGFIFNILKGQRSMTIFDKGRIFYQTCFKVISWKLFFLISKLTNVVLTLYRSFGKRYWKVAISILRKSII